MICFAAQQEPPECTSDDIFCTSGRLNLLYYLPFLVDSSRRFLYANADKTASSAALASLNKLQEAAGAYFDRLDRSSQNTTTYSTGLLV